MTKYVQACEERMLVADGWKYGSTSGTLWKADNRGCQWVVDVSNPVNKVVYFMKMDPETYRLSSGIKMEFEEYTKLFR